MLKKIMVVLMVLGMSVIFYGCASKGIEVHSYIQDRPRVDQEIEGNSGFLAGTTGNVEEPKKPTRQVIVVEVTKENKDAINDGSATKPPAEPLALPPTSFEKKPGVTTPALPVSNEMARPSTIEDKTDNMAPSSDGTYTEYKVEKDDTLQKIAKKFYNSYSKWIKIYEVNKDVITNPDKIKPGITIKIPKL